MITICFTYFRSLTLANLAAALHSVWRQDLSRVQEIIVLDNNTEDSVAAIQMVIDMQGFSVPVKLISLKHGDLTKEQAWSTNATIAAARTSWVFYTRADYLLAFDILAKFLAVVDNKPADWNGFIVSHGRHLNNDITICESMRWRETGPYVLNGVDYDYTEIDSGVWMARRESYELIGGFDERLSSWGHAQTEFQYRMFISGVEFVRLPETLFFHPQHGGAKDINLAHQQLRDIGLDIRKLWERYPGPKFY